MARQVDGLVLTIESDDEVPMSEEEGEDEVVEKGLPVVVGGVPKKQRGKGTERVAVSEKQRAAAGASEFQSAFFLEEDSLETDSEDEQGEDSTVQESWDFTKTIAEIKAKEHPAQKRTTSLDTKIQLALEARARRQAQAELEEEEGASGSDASKGSGDSDSEDPDDAVSSESGSDEEQSGSGPGSDSDSEGGQEDLDNDDDDDDDDDDYDDKGSKDEEEEEKDNSRQLGANSIVLKRKLAMERELEAKEKLSKAAAKTFAELNLSRPLIRAVQALGFDRPTPIQAKAIPFALAGRDICGSAVTGSGKTAAFVLPVLERLLYRPKRVAATRVLMVTPTRELAQQVHSMLEKLAQFTDIRAVAVVGGLAMAAQAAELRARPDVVVATPGRLIDHVRNSRSVDLDDVEILVLDEADRLLELGFQDEVTELVQFCPKSKQTLLFSATMTTSVNRLAELSLVRPVRVQADPLYDMAARLVQEFVRIKPTKEGDREALLLALCTRSFKEKCIIFFRRKQEAHRMGIVFGLCGLRAGELHGNLTQRQRLESLQRFRDGAVDFLLCTDLASRGLDISGVHYVLNYEMPSDLATYVHRVGRTARAGRGGVAVTLTGEKHRKLTKEVLKRSRKNVKSRTVPESVVDAFKDKIGGLEQDVQDVLRQERVEKETRVAEMEANKAINMVSHRDEILARPAKSWFQSNRRKEEVRQQTAALAAELDGLAGEGDTSKERRKSRRKELKMTAAAAAKEKRPHRMDRKKRRRLAMLEEEAQDAKYMQREAKEQAEAEGRRVDAEELRKLSTPSDQTVMMQAKAAKRKVREEESAMAKAGGQDVDGMDAKKLKKLKNKRLNSKKRERQEAREAATAKFNAKKRAGISHDSVGFGSELRPGQGMTYLERRARKKKKGGEPSAIFKEMDLSKGGLRKGGKLGKAKFKSKSRHKRR